MEIVKDLTQLKQLIKDNKARFDSVAKNNMLMLSGLDSRIRNHEVSFDWSDSGLLIFLDEQTYFNMYYYISDGSNLPEVYCDKPVLIEEPELNLSEKTGEKEKLLSKTGFHLYRRNIHVVKDLKNVEQISYSENHESTDEIQFIELSYNDPEMPGYLEKSSDLWRLYLGKTDLPKEHFSVSPDDHLICAINGNGELAGTHWWKNHGRLSEGRHTVTAPEYYRRGIARELIRRWCVLASNAKADRAATWISDKNTKSLNLYSKMGFVKSGKVIRQYIREV